MIIDGFDKLTLLDYPEYLACIIFTRGCNFNCSYCHNCALIKNSSAFGRYKEDEILEYLELRKNKLEGLVISGGEPTLQKGLIEFIIKVKKIGLKVKLDTNGTNPKMLKYLIDNELVDYVAMDIKNSFEKYKLITKCNVNVELIKDSIEILKNSRIDREFRTTIIKEYHEISDIKSIIEVIGDEKYYLQNFVISDSVYDKTLHGFTDEELIDIRKKIGLEYKNIKIRGIIDNNLLLREDKIYYV